jgi:hypothetical protein
MGGHKNRLVEGELEITAMVERSLEFKIVLP